MGTDHCQTLGLKVRRAKFLVDRPLSNTGFAGQKDKVLWQQSDVKHWVCRPEGQSSLATERCQTLGLLARRAKFLGDRALSNTGIRTLGTPETGSVTKKKSITFAKQTNLKDIKQHVEK